MRRILFIVVISLFFCGCAKNEKLKGAWNHFWCLSETSPEQQVQTIPSPQYNYPPYKPVVIFHQKSIDRIDEDGRVNYKLQKKLFANDSIDIPFELVWR